MIQRFFRNISLRKKILIICLLVGLLPILLLGVVLIFRTRNLMLENEQSDMQWTLSQQKLALNGKMEKCIQTTQSISWDENIRRGLSGNYESMWDMYLFYYETLEPSFYNAKYFNASIKNIMFYTNTPIYYNAGVLESLEVAQNQSWYPLVSNDYREHWIHVPEENKLFLIMQVYDFTNEYRAFLKIDIEYAELFSSLQNLYESSYGVLLEDGNGIPIYQFQTRDMEKMTVSSQYLMSEQALSHGYVIEKATDIGDGWTLWLYRPTDIVLKPVKQNLYVLSGIIVFSLVGVIIVSLLLGTYIIRPLETLTKDIQQVEKGIWVSRNCHSANDEIGYLTRKFQDMVAELNDLLEQLVQERVLQKEYELKALRAQINPHFLYNSLSLINSKAILSGQVEIEQMVRFLTDFYRTTLNGGRDYTTVRNELKNIQSYIGIQLLMHENSFQVFYDIDGDILDFKMPNLLIQPLVENAIIHGIDVMKNDKVGVLRISGKRCGERIIFRISDNGPGVSMEKLDNILNQKSKDGYGILNVHQRVQFTYGDSYGLKYESVIGEGTVAILVLPVCEDVHDDE